MTHAVSRRLPILLVALAALLLALTSTPVAAQDNSAPDRPKKPSFARYTDNPDIGPYVFVKWDNTDHESVTHYQLQRRAVNRNDGTKERVTFVVDRYPKPHPYYNQYFDRTVESRPTVWKYSYRVRAVNEHGKSPWSRYIKPSNRP